MFKLIIFSVLLAVVAARPSHEIGHIAAPLEHHHYPAAVSHQSQVIYHGHHYGHGHDNGLYDHHLVSPLIGHHDGLYAAPYYAHGYSGYGHGHGLLHGDYYQGAAYHHGGYHH